MPLQWYVSEKRFTSMFTPSLRQAPPEGLCRSATNSEADLWGGPPLSRPRYFIMSTTCITKHTTLFVQVFCNIYKMSKQPTLFDLSRGKYYRIHNITFI